MPSGFDIYFAAQPGDQTAVDSASGEASATMAADARFGRAVKLLKLVRIVRMVRMVRLLRMLKVFKMVKQIMRPDSPLMNLYDTFVIATISHTRKLRIAVLVLKMLLITHVQVSTMTQAA